MGDSVSDPVGYYRNNVMGTLATLEAMAAESCRRFVFSSTCAVYGEPIETPIRETHPTAPINAYGQTKLAIEQALPHFERAYGICGRSGCATSTPPAPIRTASWAKTTIPRSTSSRARSRRPPAARRFKIFGDDYPTPDGTCLRDYIHVTDLADAHVRALRRLEAGGRVADATTSAPSARRRCGR